MALKLETQRLPGSRLEIRVQADTEEIDKAFESAFSYLSQEAQIPGFRPGKAPRPVLERRFEADTIRQLAWQRFLERSYLPALEDLTIRPVGQPQMPELDEVEDFQAGEPLEMTNTVVVHPEPQLPDYRSLKLLRPSTEVTEEEVDEHIELLRQAQATRQPVERDQVEAGDVVTAQVQVLDPESGEVLEKYQADFAASSESENELEQKLIGVQQGESVEYEHNLSEDQEDPKLAGKTVLIKATVEKLEEKILPELDDELAHTIDESLSTVAELREYIRERLQKQFTEAADRTTRSLAMALVERDTEIDLPEELVQSLTNSEINRYMGDLQAEGLSIEEAVEAVSDQESGLRQHAQSSAQQALKRHYIFAAIAEQERLEVTEEDLSQALSDYAQEHGLAEATLQQMVVMQPETEEQFRAQALESKVKDLLVENAEIEEVPREGYPVRVRRLLEGEPKAGESVEELSEEVSEVRPAERPAEEDTSNPEAEAPEEGE